MKTASSRADVIVRNSREGSVPLLHSVDVFYETVETSLDHDGETGGAVIV